MGSAAITVGGGAAIGEGHRTAGAGWTGLVGAGRGRLPPVCAPSPDQVAVLNLNLELATDTASITVSGCNVSGTCISGRRVYGPVSRIDGRTVYRERICR